MALLKSQKSRLRPHINLVKISILLFSHLILSQLSRSPYQVKTCDPYTGGIRCFFIHT